MEGSTKRMNPEPITPETPMVAVPASYIESIRTLFKRLTELVHPDYGECDMLADGGCSECHRIISEASSRLAKFEAVALAENQSGSFRLDDENQLLIHTH